MTRVMITLWDSKIVCDTLLLIKCPVQWGYKETQTNNYSGAQRPAASAKGEGQEEYLPRVADRNGTKSSHGAAEVTMS